MARRGARLTPPAHLTGTDDVTSKALGYGGAGGAYMAGAGVSAWGGIATVTASGVSTGAGTVHVETVEHRRRGQRRVWRRGRRNRGGRQAGQRRDRFDQRRRFVSHPEGDGRAWRVHCRRLRRMGWRGRRQALVRRSDQPDPERLSVGDRHRHRWSGRNVWRALSRSDGRQRQGQDQADRERSGRRPGHDLRRHRRLDDGRGQWLLRRLLRQGGDIGERPECLRGIEGVRRRGRPGTGRRGSRRRGGPSRSHGAGESLG